MFDQCKEVIRSVLGAEPLSRSPDTIYSAGHVYDHDRSMNLKEVYQEQYLNQGNPPVSIHLKYLVAKEFIVLLDLMKSRQRNGQPLFSSRLIETSY